MRVPLAIPCRLDDPSSHDFFNDVWPTANPHILARQVEGFAHRARCLWIEDAALKYRATDFMTRLAVSKSPRSSRHAA
jgi:hypothetical protein